MVIRMKKKKKDEKEIERMIDAIRGNIRKGLRCVSFFLKDGEVRTIFIKMGMEREITGNEKKEDLKEKLRYIG